MTVYSKVEDHTRHMMGSLLKLREQLADNGKNTLLRIRLLLAAEALEEIVCDAAALDSVTRIGQQSPEVVEP